MWETAQIKWEEGKESDAEHSSFSSNKTLSGPLCTENLCSCAFKVVFLHYELTARHPRYLSSDRQHISIKRKKLMFLQITKLRDC